MKISILYVASIIVANLGFVYLPMVPLPFGEMFAPMSLLVGFIFVIRDFAQKQIGHKVLGLMAIGTSISYLLADPFVAIASAVAFGISETADWLYYSVSKKSLKNRILVSSAISTPIDSAVFMLIAGFFSWYGLLVMIFSKMLGAYLVWRKL